MRRAVRTGRWPLAGAAVAGVLAGLGQAPWGLWPLTLAGLAVLLALIARAPGSRAGFWRGWAGAAGMFVLAMSWIVEPFLVAPERHAWMAPFALLMLPGGLALFWGAASALALRWTAPGAGRLWALAVLVTGAEALRGRVLTGFPWAMPGHVWIDTPVAQAAALVGPLGLTLLTLALAAGLAALADPAARGALAPRSALALRLAALAAPGGLLALAWSWGLAQLALPMPPDRDQRVRLVQPNATQALKWDPRYAEMFFFRHLDLTAAPAADGRAPDLVLWSETAVPFFLDSPGAGLAMAADAAGGATLVLGIQRRAPNAYGALSYFNSLAVLDADGTPVLVHDKHHLVPFGEYVPLVGHLADRPGLGFLSGLAAQTLAGYTPGPGPAVLDLGPLGLALPLICYEAIFPRHLRTPQRADWLMQLTNDAWFGEVSGPFQHLAQARLRTIEQGLPMLRAANTGVSAVIDARGRVVAELGLGVAGFLDADLPGALPPTLYARTGDWPWHLALALLAAAIALRGRRKPVKAH